MNKLKFTKKGKSAIKGSTGDVYYPAFIIDRYGLNIGASIELGILEEVPDEPERIRLAKHRKGWVFIDDTGFSVGELSKKQQEVAEHALNNEWHLIPDCMEFVADKIITIVDLLTQKLKNGS